jgi:hypothetical protein
MKLNLGLGAPKTDYHEEATSHAMVVVTLSFSNNLPDQIESISMGDTFAQVKKRIADTHGVSYTKISLTLEDSSTLGENRRDLLDPFSLSDIKEIKGRTEVTIVVDIKE